VTPTARVTRMRWHSGVLAWALWALAMLGVATIPWFDHLLRQARRPELIQLDATAGHTTRSAGCSWRWGWR
jgi:hypothetical protein